MNTVLVFEHEKIKEREELAFLIRASNRVETIQKQLKLKVGDRLHITFVNHGTGFGRIQELTAATVIIDQLELETPHYPSLTLLLGASRPPTMKKILEHGTTMGITRFIIFAADLTEKSYLDSKILATEESHKYLEFGLAQARERYLWPEIEVHHHLPELKQFSHLQKFILDLGAPETFLGTDLKNDEELVLAIGPERGWSERERQLFKQAIFRPICLSRVALRVEHAVFSALAQIELCQIEASR